MLRDRLNRREFGRLVGAGAAGLGTGSLALGADATPAGVAEERGEPLPFVPGSFTLALLPDTQYYSQSYPHHFHNQTQWIVDNAARFNIRYVLHLGDVTNQNTPEQWRVARAALARLDGKVPYALAAGNHDYGTLGNAASRDTYLNEHFPFAAHTQQAGFGAALDDGRLENTFHRFEVNGQKYLILALEWGPRDRVVDWANKIVGQHSDHRVILDTHAYMYYDETRYDWTKFGDKQQWNPHSYATAKQDAGTNDGEDLWQKLVSKHPNFLMTVNGHVLGDGLARLDSPGASGKPVHQMLVNYQMKKEGGEAFLRLVEFLPDGNTIQVRAYSPSLNQFKTDSQNQFVLRGVG